MNNRNTKGEKWPYQKKRVNSVGVSFMGQQRQGSALQNVGCTGTDPKKKCKKCGEEKPHTSYFFRRDSSVKSGFKAVCKDCMRVIEKLNSGKTKARKAAYYLENKDRIDSRNAKWAKKNRDKRNAAAKRLRDSDREKSTSMLVTGPKETLNIRGSTIKKILPNLHLRSEQGRQQSKTELPRG